MKVLFNRTHRFTVWHQILVAVLVFCCANTAVAQSWFIGVPNPDQPNLLRFRTPVPQDFVAKIMQQQGAKAPYGKSYQRKINGTNYSILEQKIGWDPPTFGRGGVSFVTPTGVGNTWEFFTGNEWDAFKQTLVNISKTYNGPWRQADLMVMQIPAGVPADVTINLITPFVAADAPSEQAQYAALSPRIVAVPVGNAIAVGYQTEFKRQAQAAQVDLYRPGGAGPAWTATLPLKVFGGLTSDGQNVYALSAQAEDLGNELNTVNFRANLLKLTKLDSNGRVVWEKDLNNAEVMGSRVDGGMEAKAIYSPFTAGTAQLAYGNGQVAVVMACNTTPDLPINSRHQRAVFFTVNANDGSGSASQSETSWRHSFDQRAIFDGKDFVFADLGDAGWYMPAAGIALRKGLPIDKKTSFPGPAEGVYVYARPGDQTAYSNFSFTSLGDIVYDQKGYGVLFTSQRGIFEPPANGFDTPIQAPRQLGFVHVVEPFETVKDATFYQDGNRVPQAGNVIMDTAYKPERIDITQNVVDSSGTNAGPYAHPTRTKTFFNQRGVVWITELANGTSAERPKMVRLSNGLFLALWEEWTYQGTGQNIEYKETKAVILQDRGNGRFEAGQTRTINARLNPSGSDRVFVRNEKANWVIGESDGRLMLHQVDANLNLSSTTLGESAIPEGSAPPIANRGRDTQPAGNPPQPAVAQADFPKGYFYMTTKAGEGQGLVLESSPLELRKRDNFTGMFWKAIPIGDGYYYLTTQFLDEKKQVLEGSDGQGDAVMVANEGFTGTQWKVIRKANGDVVLTNKFLEAKGMVLGSVGGALRMVKEENDNSKWKFVPVPN